MDKKIRFALIGCGGRGIDLAATYFQHPNAELVAICDIADGVAEEAASHLHGILGNDIAFFTSYEELVKQAVYDAAIIACDPDIQVQFAVAEMNRGIHVMTEVPAAYTIDQCWDLVNTVRKTGCKYQLAEQTRYWNTIAKWRELARNNYFGKIYYVEGEYLHYSNKWDYFCHKDTHLRVKTNDPSYHNNPDYEPSWRYRTFMDPIYYLPHELSPLLSITGGRIERVSCFGTRKGSYASEGFDCRDLQCAIMHNSNDVIFSLRAGFSSPHGEKRDFWNHWYQVKGSNRSVETSRSMLDTPKEFDPQIGWIEHPEWGTVDPNAPEEFRLASHGGADYYPFYYFMKSILEDTTPPMDVYKAVETAAPAILAVESCKRGGEMLLVPDFRK